MIHSDDGLTSSWHGERVSAAAVEQALGRMLRELNPPTGAAAPSTRASVLNLIVHAPSDDLAARAAETLGELSGRHPSRTLVVTTDPAAEPGLDAFASAHCHLGAGASRRVCFEEVRLIARGALGSHLASVVAPLLVPDLPVVLWWLGPPPDPNDGLLRVADRLIVDSADFTSADLARIAIGRDSLVQRVVRGDLAWSALAPWRELIAQLFDAPAARPHQRSISEVRVEYAAGGEVSRALLLLGWLATRLGWEPAGRIEWSDDGGEGEFVGARGPVRATVVPTACPGACAPGDVTGARLASASSDGGASFEVVRLAEGNCAAKRVALPDFPSVDHLAPLVRPPLAALLGQELGRVGPDLAYETSLEFAGVVA